GALNMKNRIGAGTHAPQHHPMHWIYNLDSLKEFRAESQTCYGDQAFVLLESLSHCGDVNAEDLTQRTYSFFGPGTVHFVVNSSGPKAELPINGPWRNASLKSFIRNVDARCEVDCQMDCVTKIAPVVAMFAGRAQMLDKVEMAVRVTQNNDICVAMALAAARFVEHFILNGPDPNVLDAVLGQLKDPARQNPQELDKAVIAHINQVKGNLAKESQELIPAGALHGLLTHSRLEEAVRDTMRCGGCTSSRASFIGACFGAQVRGGIPESWRNRTFRYPLLIQLANKVVNSQQDTA
uniref:Uncharacterized protein n=1 Tax=Gadus morhua TaxID=8049 RepID=A0A8C4ZPS5_GADMO